MSKFSQPREHNMCTRYFTLLYRRKKKKKSICAFADIYAMIFLVFSDNKIQGQLCDPCEFSTWLFLGGPLDHQDLVARFARCIDHHSFPLLVECIDHHDAKEALGGAFLSKTAVVSLCSSSFLFSFSFVLVVCIHCVHQHFLTMLYRMELLFLSTWYINKITIFQKKKNCFLEAFEKKDRHNYSYILLTCKFSRLNLLSAPMYSHRVV